MVDGNFFTRSAPPEILLRILESYDALKDVVALTQTYRRLRVLSTNKELLCYIQPLLDTPGREPA